MTALRRALGRFGDKTTMRGFARELGMSPQGYRYWEKPGSYPGHAKLANALSNVDAVKARKLDPSQLAIWLETGQGDPPWVVADAATATVAPRTFAQAMKRTDLDERTPWRLIVTLADLAQQGRQEELYSLLGVVSPVAESVLKTDERKAQAP